MKTRALPIAAALAALFAARAASAACTNPRPSDPGGAGGWSYGADPVASFDGQKVRVWYATSGANAPDLKTTRMDLVPDNVARVAAVGDDALAKYQGWGFSLPPSDNGSSGCSGGDGRLDIYLLAFNAADGQTATESCSAGAAKKCASYVLVERKLENLYGTFDEGARTVVPHELFHAVQNAYDSGVDRFWAEGTAQWATKRVDPTLVDLERNLPAFFMQPGRSIDLTGGGVTSGFLYGAAIWPVFLAERQGPDIVKAALEEQAKTGPTSMNAVDRALMAANASIAAEYPTFAAWNAACGKRAGKGGYPDAKLYPTSPVVAFPDAGEASGVLTGFGMAYFSYDFGADKQQLTMEADPTRLGARVFPLDASGKADLSQMTELPAIVTGPGILVVAGITAKKADAPFTVRVGAPPIPGADAGADGGTAAPKGGGCAVSPAPSASLAGWALLAPLAILGLSRRRTRRR